MVAASTIALTGILAPVIGAIVQQAIAGISSSGSKGKGKSRIYRQFKSKKYLKKGRKARVNHYSAKYQHDIREIRSGNGASNNHIQLL